MNVQEILLKMSDENINDLMEAIEDGPCPEFRACECCGAVSGMIQDIDVDSSERPISIFAADIQAESLRRFGKAKCPSCGNEGIGGAGCPTCPGFWYSHVESEEAHEIQT